MVSKIHKSDQQWLQQLTTEQFQICRLKGTERPFSGKYNNEKSVGIYHCVCCEHQLFDSEAKFESGSGWPSFCSPISEDSVVTENDFTHGMQRVEVMCGKCDSHLGHVFEDGPAPTGLRYCMNSISLRLEKIDE